MREQIEGSQAVAKAVAACRPEVIAAYPISPQTHIVEALSALVNLGYGAGEAAAAVAGAAEPGLGTGELIRAALRALAPKG